MDAGGDRWVTGGDAASGSLLSLAFLKKPTFTVRREAENGG